MANVMRWCNAYDTIRCDAMQYNIKSEENVFTLFNPFDHTLLNPVVDRIASSFREHPREGVIIYYNAKWKSIFDGRKEFSMARELDLFGIKSVIYRCQAKLTILLSWLSWISLE